MPHKPDCRCDQCHCFIEPEKTGYEAGGEDLMGKIIPEVLTMQKHHKILPLMVPRQAPGPYTSAPIITTEPEPLTWELIRDAVEKMANMKAPKYEDDYWVLPIPEEKMYCRKCHRRFDSREPDGSHPDGTLTFTIFCSNCVTREEVRERIRRDNETRRG